MRKLVYILTIAALWWPSATAAHPRAHLAMAHAQAAIVHYFGPGTVITKCRRFAPQLIGCDYETPAINISVEGGWIWSSFATVDTHGVHAPGFE